MELNGDLIPIEIAHDMITLEPTGDTMLTETREDLKQELQDPEFAYYYGADQAKIQLAFTLMDARNQVNLTQKEVADKLKVSQPYIAQLERGDANPTISKIGGMLAQIGLRLRTRTEPLLPQSIPASVIFLTGEVSAIGVVATTADFTFKRDPYELLYKQDLVVSGATAIRGDYYVSALPSVATY